MVQLGTGVRDVPLPRGEPLTDDRKDRLRRGLRGWLGDHGKTAQDLAEAAELPLSTVKKYVSGETFPPEEKANALFRVTGVQVLQERNNQGSLLGGQKVEGEPRATERAADGAIEQATAQDPQAGAAGEPADETAHELEPNAGRLARFKALVPQAPRTDAAEPVEAARHEIFLPVHGFVRLTDSELAVLNHPAMQRLGAIYQLGQVYLVYRGGTHRRLEHALGTLHVAQQIATAVWQNHRDAPPAPGRPGDAALAAPLNPIEVTFLRLGALLHDIGHLPAGHTLEDELGLLEKHDDHDHDGHRGWLRDRRGRVAGGGEGDEEGAQDRPAHGVPRRQRLPASPHALRCNHLTLLIEPWHTIGVRPAWGAGRGFPLRFVPLNLSCRMKI